MTSNRKTEKDFQFLRRLRGGKQTNKQQPNTFCWGNNAYFSANGIGRQFALNFAPKEPNLGDESNKETGRLAPNN